MSEDFTKCTKLLLQFTRVMAAGKGGEELIRSTVSGFSSTPAQNCPEDFLKC